MNTKDTAFMTSMLVSLAAATAACGGQGHSAAPDGEPHRDERAEPTRSQALIPVTLAPVELVPLARPLRAMGRVTHARDLKLAFKTGGVVADVLVDEGERVVAGQSVARLDPREIDAAIAQASAGLAKANRDLTRAKGLADEAVIPGAQRDDAQTAQRVAAAALAGARWNRDTTVLVAPGPGVVLKRLAEPGEVAGPGIPVLVIGLDAADGKTLVDVGVPARDAALLAVDDLASVRLDGTATDVPARIVEIAPALVPGTDQVTVTVALETPSTHRLARGLVARVTFELARAGTLPAVPVSAIAEGEGRNAFVYTLGLKNGHGHKVSRRPIVIEAVRSDGRVLVRSGLEGVRQVVDAGSAWLDAQSLVIVTPNASTSAEGVAP